MELPASLYGATVTEGNKYFFTSDCPVGIKDHIHICLKRGDTVFLFATASSQVEKAKRRAAILGYNPKTYPVFLADEINQLRKAATYIDCNNPVEISHKEFAGLMQKGLVHELAGNFDSQSLNLIIEGVMCSSLVENRIKEMLKK